MLRRVDVRFAKSLLCGFEAMEDRPASGWLAFVALAAEVQTNLGKWQPVGESNPSYLVENQTS